MPQHRTRLRTAATTVVAAATALPVLALAPSAAAEPAEDGPDLIVSELQTTDLTLGEANAEQVTITNRGKAAVDGVVFRTRITRGLDFPAHEDGCTYTTGKDKVQQAVCHLDLQLAPGAHTKVPVPFKVLPNALLETVEYGTSADGKEPGEGYDESYHQLQAKADSSADLAAEGDRAKGEPGDTVHVTAGHRNDGPGWVHLDDSDDQPAVLVTIPKGTKAVEVPKECAPFGVDGPSGPGGTKGKPRYVCWPEDATFDVGSVHRYTFGLKIKAGATTSTGKVKATSVYDIHPEFDPKTSNDTASLKVEVTGGGDGEPGDTTGGGSGGKPQGGHGDEVTATPSAPAPGVVTGGTTGGHSPAPSGGKLASTGSGSTPLLAGSAAAALLVGGAAVVVARRRRSGSSS
ncbi:LAETG motif-containing sortase-dependent surface protein [Streptomyces sp. NPDC058045]|uniref:LAETG motif-containing sortase-dependent surface protein n=1 Tax=Streptomyces sp. NPDC058045 TaxID=3346311 RepID=UPI0036E672BC